LAVYLLTYLLLKLNGETAWQRAKSSAIQKAIEAKIRHWVLFAFNDTTACPTGVPGIRLTAKESRAALSLEEEGGEVKEEELLALLWQRVVLERERVKTVSEAIAGNLINK